MALQHASYLEIIDLATPAPIGSTSSSSSLLRTGHLQILRLVLPQGASLPTHHLAGESTIQCLSGDVDLIASQGEYRLKAGQLIALAAGEANSVQAREASVLLMTLLRVQGASAPGPG